MPEYIVYVSVGKRNDLYKYDTSKPNIIRRIEYTDFFNCLDTTKRTIFDSATCVYYFLDEEKFGGYYKGEEYFLSNSENDSVLQDICSKNKYTINNLILNRYGSFQKYAELLQKDDEENSFYLEIPKTIEEALEVLRNDYSLYFECNPEDTLTAIVMLIDEMTRVVRLDTQQRQILKQRIINALPQNVSINARNYEDAFSVRHTPGRPYIGMGRLNFYRIIESILTKSQMDIYLKYRNKQAKVERNVRIGLFGIIGKFPERLTKWDEYQQRNPCYCCIKRHYNKNK